MRICDVPGCGKRHKAKGKCNAHYRAERLLIPEVRDRQHGYHTKWHATHPDWVKPRNWERDNPNEARRTRLNAVHRNRARAAGVEVDETLDAFEVFDEEGWICGVCGDPVDPKLRRPNMMSVSLDHIIPIIEGGSHTRDNVQTTHLYCNVVVKH
jgi:5-methylcytosine-specific restriction endonuclease McrA